MTDSQPRLDAIDLISLPYKFDTTDGRSIQGILIAIDDQGNLLVSEATETNGDIERDIGLVSIPKTSLKKVWARTEEWEKNLRLKQKEVSKHKT